MIAGAQSCLPLLAAEPLSAARSAAVAFAPTWTTSPSKSRARNLHRTPSGRLSRRAHRRPMFTPGSRACGYRTASGRAKWLSRDPLEEEETPNVYRFTWNDSINSIDILGQLAASQCQCGPDVTQYVNKTLDDIKQTFDKLNKKMKKKACKNILGRNNVKAGSNWDVNWLINLAPGSKGASCSRTVTYDQKCFRDDALWYFLFGKAAGLCKKEFPNDFGDPMADLLDGLIKRSEGGGGDSDEFIGNKVEVATHFYNGALLSNQNPKCPIQEGGPKDTKVDPQNWWWDGVKQAPQ